jgi:hypothetical protein
MKKIVLKLLLAMAFCFNIDGGVVYAQVQFTHKSNDVIMNKLKQKYKYVGFETGYYIVSHSPQKEKVGVCDSAGNEIISLKYDKVNPYDDFVLVTLNRKVGLMDSQGKEIIAPKYDKIEGIAFLYGYTRSDYATVTLNGKQGVIEKQGKEIIPCAYTYAAPCELAIINENKQASEAVRTKARIVKGGEMVNPVSGLPFPVNGKWGLYDMEQQKMIIDCKYDYLDVPMEGLVRFNVGGKQIEETYKRGASISGGMWGYVDLTGKEIIPAQYDTAGDFEDGVAVVSKNKQSTLIKNPLTSGNVAIDPQIAGLMSDIDRNIPVSKTKNNETFAFIFANESYMEYNVPFAINDGKIFKMYCTATLGVSDNNIRFYENATYGNLISSVNKIKEIAEAYDGEAKFIIYYSGQGATDEKSNTSYLLPVDAVLTNLTATGYSVEKLTGELSNIPAKSVFVALDACFNGADRDGKMLTSARGVSIKAKPEQPEGNVILLTAATGDETAYAFKENNHGLFTYFLLKKLQETKGEITYQTLADNVISEVKKQTVSYNKTQSPALMVSNKLTDWQTLKIK